MGTSVNWYMVDPEAFKRYVKIGNKFDKLEEKLYKRYQSIFDADSERFKREWEEACDGKRPAKSVKDVIPIYKVVSPEEFDVWFDLMRQLNSSKSDAMLVPLPQLNSGSSYGKVLTQWLLNRRKKNLVKSGKSDDYEMRPKNEEWRFLLTREDVTDLLKRLEKVCGANAVSAHKAFPVHTGLMFGHIRKKYLLKDERTLIPRVSETFLKMLKFTIQYVVGDLAGPGARHRALMVEILP